MILCYHRINPWYKNDAITVSPANFSSQINYLLSKGFKFISMEESIKIISNSLSKNVVITFDDGFADNLWFALEVLKKFKITPIIFLTVSYIGTDKIFARYQNKEKDRFLNWKEVIEMTKNGVEFGSHTLTHPFLTKITRQQAEKEIIDSRKIIEDKTGKEVKFFCYPYGDYNSEIIEIVEKSGYKAAVTNRKKNMKITKFTLPRIGIYSHNNKFIFRIKIWREYIREKF